MAGAAAAGNVDTEYGVPRSMSQGGLKIAGFVEISTYKYIYILIYITHILHMYIYISTHIL